MLIEAKQKYFELLDKAQEGGGMTEYHKKECSECYKNQYGDFVVFEKPRIKTHFCFGHGQNGISTLEEEKNAVECENVARNDANYFKQENMEKLIHQYGCTLIAEINLENENQRHTSEEWDKIDARKREIVKKYDLYYNDENALAYFISYPTNECGFPYNQTAKFVMIESWRLEHESWRYREATLHKLNLDEIKQHRSYLEQEIQKFDKRLNTYLKRFGLSKLHTWTYLID